MRVLDPGFDSREVFGLVVSAPRAALLLDYDGTLAPFTPQRERAFPYPGVREAIARISGEGWTRLAIVSGRAIADLAPLLGVDALPELWGSHGLEHRTARGDLVAAPASPALLGWIDAAAAWVEGQEWGHLLERKPYGLALHARGTGAAEFRLARDGLLRRWGRQAEEAGLESLGFD
ncbi:MAG: trehalose-phosphatase, partial [Vicinamibacteria bacterium]